jgi:carbamate kinase
MDRNKAFGEGSMAPKIRAAIDFVRRSDAVRRGVRPRAIITSLARGREAVHEEAGTTITA